MPYFRWYPVVSHFNNPPQLDVLVPSARQCLVIGPGWEPCWGLPSSTLMESTMRHTHPIFYCFASFPSVFSFSEPDGASWVLRLPQAGVRAGHGREESHLDLMPCIEDLSLNIKALTARGAWSSCCLRKGHHESVFKPKWGQRHCLPAFLCCVKPSPQEQSKSLLHQWRVSVPLMWNILKWLVLYVHDEVIKETYDLSLFSAETFSPLKLPLASRLLQ